MTAIQDPWDSIFAGNTLASVRRSLQWIRFPVSHATREAMPGDFEPVCECLLSDSLQLQRRLTSLFTKFGLGNPPASWFVMPEHPNHLIRYLAGEKFLQELLTMASECMKATELATALDDLLSYRDWLEKSAETLISTELANQGLKAIYVVYDFESGISETVHFGGLTQETLAEILRPAIGPRWRGSGPAMLICARKLLLLLGDVDAAKSMIATYFVHELSHIVDGPRLCWPGQVEPSEVAMARWVKFVSSVPTTDLTTAQDGYVWADQKDAHGPSFVRILCHLATRAATHGIPIVLSHLHNWTDYANLTYTSCFSSLREEIAGHEGRSIASIKAIAMPDTFVELFQGTTNDR